MIGSLVEEERTSLRAEGGDKMAQRKLASA
jgi:hypothetical protein